MSNLCEYKQNARHDLRSRLWLRKIDVRNRLIERLSKMPAGEERDLLTKQIRELYARP